MSKLILNVIDQVCSHISMLFKMTPRETRYLLLHYLTLTKSLIKAIDINQQLFVDALYLSSNHWTKVLLRNLKLLDHILHNEKCGLVVMAKATFSNQSKYKTSELKQIFLYSLTKMCHGSGWSNELVFWFVVKG